MRNLAHLTLACSPLPGALRAFPGQLETHHFLAWRLRARDFTSQNFHFLNHEVASAVTYLIGLLEDPTTVCEKCLVPGSMLYVLKSG